jgi:hypothetical protein
MKYYWVEEAETLAGREVDAWIIDGGKSHPFNWEAAAEDVTRVAVDLEFPSGSFEVRNYQLEAYATLPVPAVESEPYRRKCQPWQRRKKGRS